MELATAVRDNVPNDICKVFSYSLGSKKKITKDNAYCWVNVIAHIHDAYIGNDKYYRIIMERDNIQLDNSIIEWCENQYNTTYKELKKLEDKEELLKNSITNSRNNVKKQLQKEFEEKLKSYNLSSEVISSGNGCVFFYKNKIKKLNSDNSWGYKTIMEPIISDEDFSNLMHDIEDYIISKVREYGLEKIFERDTSYFIIHKNKLEYFGIDISKVKINLSDNQTELICMNEEVEEHLAYHWPSDAPTIRTTTSYVITFNTDNNEVKSYDVNTDTEEIKNKYYRY